MEEMEVVALAARCGQGWPLALGGICRAGYGARWRRQLAALRPALTAADLYMLDVQLARALSAAADETLWVAGASLCRPGLPLSPGQSTGGVIGDPGQAPASSPDGGERLGHGLSLYTAPGGPGLAAPAGPEQLAAALRRAGLTHALLVLDGTGPGVRGGVLALSGDTVQAALLPRCDG